jgi:hypothetical protein
VEEEAWTGEGPGDNGWEGWVCAWDFLFRGPIAPTHSCRYGRDAASSPFERDRVEERQAECGRKHYPKRRSLVIALKDPFGNRLGTAGKLLRRMLRWDNFDDMLEYTSPQEYVLLHSFRLHEFRLFYMRFVVLERGKKRNRCAAPNRKIFIRLRRSCDFQKGTC